ncbi:MAG: DUF692 domain-containing protein [Sedimenticola sp.]|nr:DUF692 domain-containing protein [Sedimenticola sp.]
MTNSSPGSPLPYLGFGIRLRNEYLHDILQQKPDLDFIEVITENYLGGEASKRRAIEQLAQHYPLVMHGLSMAIGSPWPLDPDYLQQLKSLIEQVDPVWISDHLCWKGADDLQGTLLPLPYSEDTLEHVVSRIRQVQELLGRQILLENVPGEHSQAQEIPETEFIREVAERSDSFILLDLGNLVSSSLQQGFAPENYIAQLPPERIKQIHLPDITIQPADKGTETAGQQIIDPVWELYSQILQQVGPVSTLIERVDTIPTLKGMVSEIETVRSAVRQVYPGY